MKIQWTCCWYLNHPSAHTVIFVHLQGFCYLCCGFQLKKRELTNQSQRFTLVPGWVLVKWQNAFGSGARSFECSELADCFFMPMISCTFQSAVKCCRCFHFSMTLQNKFYALMAQYGNTTCSQRCILPSNIGVFCAISEVFAKLPCFPYFSHGKLLWKFMNILYINVGNFWKVWRVNSTLLPNWRPSCNLSRNFGSNLVPRHPHLAYLKLQQSNFLRLSSQREIYITK